MRMIQFAVGFLLVVLSLWLTTPALAGFDEGMAAYERGDYATAFEEYLPVAEQGHAAAQYKLSVMYAHGKGVPQDYAEAMKWSRLAAEQGNAKAQYNLGVGYENGFGVPQDYVTAVKWYRKAAEQGNAKAQYNLGVSYDNGKGVPKDYAEAVKWFRLAAEQGHADAQSNLALMYANGHGVPQDYAEAVKWFRLAGEQGHADAQYSLGVMYTNGKGVPQDYVQAHMWYNLAAAKGNEIGRENRDIIAKQMTPTQLAEAQQLAREWRPSTTLESGSPSIAAEPRTGSLSELLLYSTGSGFTVSSEGHVLTNDHVVMVAATPSAARCCAVRLTCP